jgi:methionyl aminopeptidase
MTIIIKSEEEIAIMRESGLINAEVRDVLYNAIEPGITGIELDNIARKEITARGASATFPGYSPLNKPPYPGAICFSVNDELVHGIPNDYSLKDGDIVSIDLGVTYRNFVSDAAFTKAVGNISVNAKTLLDATKEALNAGIQKLHIGNTLGDVSSAIQNHGKSFGIIKEYGGHGVGRDMHEDPHVPNYGEANSGLKIVKGMVLAIEPMISIGSPVNHEKSDQWTVVISDGSLSAHFEETVAVTDEGPYILTKISNGV